MKKVFMLMFGLIMLIVSIHANDPPGLYVDNNFEYVYNPADIQPVTFDVPANAIMTNSYCYVSGGTRPGVVELTVIYYTTIGLDFYDVYVEFNNYGNLAAFENHYTTGFTLNRDLIIPPRSGSYKRSAVI